MKRIIIVSGIISLFIFSCKHANSSFRQVQDKDLTIQVMELNEGTKDTGTISYKVRLIPVKQLLDKKSREEKNALMYKMDSCFYIQDGIKKTYAALVQPIANGVSGSYEYLLEFEMNKQINHDSISLTYQDKYINHKTYTIKSNQQ